MDTPQMEATDYFRKSTPAIFRLETYLPTSTIKKRNPLFDRQIRTLRWPRGLRPDELNTAEAREIQAAKIRGLKRYTRRYGLIVPMLCACVGAAILSRPYYVSMWFGLFLLYGPIRLSLLCNLYYAVTAVNRITHQSTMEQWELLRLTKLTERDILQANYATIQVRAWRLAVIEAGIRICISTMILLLLLFPARSRVQLDTTFMLDMMILLVLGSGYSLEPLWRMRAVTLIGMTFASWLDGYATAIIASLGGLVSLLLLQAGILIGCIWLFNRVIIFVYADYYGYNRQLFGQLIIITMIVAAMYLLFKGVQRAAFHLLSRVAFRG